MDVEGELAALKAEMKRLAGDGRDEQGRVSVTFGALFHDERCANVFEALVGTLRAAKKRKMVDFEGQMLLQGVHDDVAVVLLEE